MKFLKSCFNNITILDKYVLSQVVEIFILGVVIFSSIIFASEAFITLIKQISDYGVPPRIAFMIIILNLPTVIVLTIPMSMLLATVMGVNKLCLASEITVMRACGIGIDRIAKPILIFACFMTLISLAINEFVVPITGNQSKTLAIWAVGQKNIPDGKKNYTLKEMQNGFTMKRFFYVENCTKKNLENVSVIDFSNEDTTQIIQSSKGETSNNGWVFKNASVYTIDDEGELMNTSWIAKTTIDFGIDAKAQLSEVSENEYNFKQLSKYIKSKTFPTEREKKSYEVKLHEKIALPVTTIALALLGIPLAITPPRVRYNRGFLLSILIIFFFYLIKGFAGSLGELGKVPPIFAAWLPNIILGTVGYLIYRRKAYKIS